MADVARYQNDGTSRGVTPSRYIERAEAAADGWETEMADAADSFVTHGDSSSISLAARKIAQDISAMCDRIRTGRLKTSFEGRVVEQ